MATFSGSSMTQAAVNPYKHAKSEDSFLGGSKKGGQAPAPPDYVGAANAQGTQNLALARTNAQLNNPNITTPIGQRTVQFGGNPTFDETGFNAAMQAYEQQKQSGPLPGLTPPDQNDPRYQIRDGESGDYRPDTEGYQRALQEYNQQLEQQRASLSAPSREAFMKAGSPDQVFVNETFAPEAQKVFDNELTLQQMLGELGIGAAGMAADTISQPLDFDGRFGTQAVGRQEVIDSMMSRYDKDAAGRMDQMNSDLVARGIPSGSKAYETEVDRFSRGRNDALQQATLASDAKAMDERRQAITEALAERQIPLNEISAFRAGSQIQPLQFQNYSGVTAQGTPLFDATKAAGDYQTDMWNAKQAQGAQTTGMIGSMAAMAAMYF